MVDCFSKFTNNQILTDDYTRFLLTSNQVGIIGRTGAGKSSILNALFRLAPICTGHIIVDGINISDVPARDLRAHFAVVPQSPFLFEGSLRYLVEIAFNLVDYIFVSMNY